MMFLKSRCNGYAVNTDQILYIGIQRDGCESEYALVATMRDEEDIWLACSDCREKLEKIQSSIVAEINSDIQSVYVKDGRVSTS